MQQRYQASPGEKSGLQPNEPVVQIIPSGPQTYLWIGNDAQGDMRCFATLEGVKELRSLARNILKAIGDSSIDPDKRRRASEDRR